MSEDEFWNCTPKKLDALLSIHLEIKGASGEKQKGYIDDILL